jgi:hypothetical protein
MSIFGAIMDKLGFGDDDKQEEVVEQVEAAPEASENLAETSEPEVQSGGEAVVVDVAAVLEEKAANNPEDLDWKVSIVDLMKLLDLDSSYAHRKELAGEMGIDGYHGTEDQNIALHKAVLAKLASNGGNIPADLL